MTEATIIKRVRQDCVFRDGHCRVGRVLLALFGSDYGGFKCQGGSEWAHFGPWQRWRTMGEKDPTKRHCVQGSLMLCHLHHTLYDGKFVRFGECRTIELKIEALSDRYADGPLVLLLNGVRYEEAA